MAKRKKKKETPAMIFKRGCTLKDGTRFEAGDEVPDSLTTKERKALEELDAFMVLAESE